MRDRVSSVVRAAKQESRKIRITFERVEYLDYLLLMMRQGFIELSKADEKVLTAVADSGDWGEDRNRTVSIALTRSFDENFFVDRMSERGALEDIEVA